MKIIILLLVLCYGSLSYAQTTQEAAVLKLSKEIFQWEVANKIDAIEKIFHEKFVVVSGDGTSKNKEQYMATLRSGNFIHNSIDVEENTATIVNNTATVVGKGKFVVTISGKENTLLLSYIEVFTRPNSKKGWKVLAMHATVLQH